MEYAVFIVVVLIFFVFVLMKGIFTVKREKKKFIIWLKENYGVLLTREYNSEEFRACQTYFQKHKNEGFIDDITWNDLNMDDLYKKMNYSFSSAGDEYLYYVLRTPCFQVEELEKREKLISFFQTNESNRIYLQQILKNLGRTGKFSIYDYLDHLDFLKEQNKIYTCLSALLFIPAIFICFFNPSLGVTFIIMLAIRNILVYFRKKKEIEPYIISFSYIMKLLRAAEQIEKCSDTVYQEECELLKKSRKNFSGFKRGSFWIISSPNSSGNPLDLLLDYCRMIFHIDLIKFNSMLSVVRKQTHDIDILISTIGYLEAMISIGAFREHKQNEYCIPNLKIGEVHLTVKDVYHPLLVEPVKNSISTKKGILLTGSNASGKSTFLRTIAVNAIMAQTIHTCFASYYESCFFNILSSMSLKDDLGNGESYYIVEIKSLKRIIDVSFLQNQPVLCFVDEVLKGTNTVERIAGATQILKGLSGKNILCFAATHDLELTQLLEKEYINYHFEEVIENEDVHFSYQLLEGCATTRNAIKLLKMMGYREDIIEAADKMAQNFIENGVWK